MSGAFDAGAFDSVAFDTGEEPGGGTAPGWREKPRIFVPGLPPSIDNEDEELIAWLLSEEL